MKRIFALAAALALTGCAGFNDAMTSSLEVRQDDFDNSIVVVQQPIGSGSDLSAGWTQLGFWWRNTNPEEVLITVGVAGIESVRGVAFRVDGRLIDSASPTSGVTDFNLNPFLSWSFGYFVMPTGDFMALADASDVRMKVLLINGAVTSSFGPANPGAVVNPKLPAFADKVRELAPTAQSPANQAEPTNDAASVSGPDDSISAALRLYNYEMRLLGLPDARSWEEFILQKLQYREDPGAQIVGDWVIICAGGEIDSTGQVPIKKHCRLENPGIGWRAADRRPRIVSPVVRVNSRHGAYIVLPVYLHTKPCQRKPDHMGVDAVSIDDLKDPKRLARMRAGKMFAREEQADWPDCWITIREYSLEGFAAAYDLMMERWSAYSGGA